MQEKKKKKINKIDKEIIKNKDISEIEKELIKNKDWQYLGEVDSKKRPVNSLLQRNDFLCDIVEKPEPISTKQNTQIMKITLQRLREGTFDNYKYRETEIETEDITENNEEENENVDIKELFNDIESELLKISDFGSIGFLPDTKIKNIAKVEEKQNHKRKSVKALGNIKNVTVLK